MIVSFCHQVVTFQAYCAGDIRIITKLCIDLIHIHTYKDYILGRLYETSGGLFRGIFGSTKIMR